MKRALYMHICHIFYNKSPTFHEPCLVFKIPNCRVFEFTFHENYFECEFPNCFIFQFPNCLIFEFTVHENCLQFVHENCQSMKIAFNAIKRVVPPPHETPHSYET